MTASALPPCGLSRRAAALLLGGACLALAAPSGAVAATAAASPLSGTYAGAYHCGTGVMGATLDLQVRQGKAEGALAFYPLPLNPGGPSGSFRMSGSVRDGALTLTPGAWIQEPSTSYGAAGIEAMISPELIVGKPTGPESWGCRLIELRRLPALR